MKKKTVVLLSVLLVVGVLPGVISHAQAPLRLLEPGL